MKKNRLLLFPFLIALSGGCAGTALAGPPFHTDDPQPVDFQHWEAYCFSTFDRTKDGRATQGPALEFNWGVVRNVQLHLELPLASFRPPGGPTSLGAGDVEMGVKYRFIQEGSHRPQVSIFPMLELPTGNARRGLGNGRVWARLPLWVQKSYGPWTTLWRWRLYRQSGAWDAQSCPRWLAAPAGSRQATDPGGRTLRGRSQRRRHSFLHPA